MPVRFDTTFMIRLSKVSLVGFFGLYVLVAAFGNVTNYGSNFRFVEAVLSMADTFDDNNLMWRAIEPEWFHHARLICS
jgi:predicted small integral membrane protein